MSTVSLPGLSRLAWPTAFVALGAMTFGYLRETRPPAASEVRIEHPSPTVLRDLRELSRLETLSLHVEKVVDVKDHQSRLYGLVGADDSLLFVAGDSRSSAHDLHPATVTATATTPTSAGNRRIAAV